MNSYIILLLLSFSLGACSEERYKPVIPKDIPTNSFWVGQPKKGYWYYVENVHSHRNAALIKVYDQRGKLMVAKQFILICHPDNPNFITNLQEQISKFDGKHIYLKSRNKKEGCYLMPRS